MGWPAGCGFAVRRWRHVTCRNCDASDTQTPYRPATGATPQGTRDIVNRLEQQVDTLDSSYMEGMAIRLLFTKADERHNDRTLHRC